MTAASTFPLPHVHALSLPRTAVTVALTLAIAFALCWVAAAAGILPRSHMFISLFTAQPVDSTAALGLGLLSSLGAGLVVGALFALIYNALAFLQRT